MHPIRQYRYLLGLNQRDFAKLIPISVNGISRWENGQMPSPTNILRLAIIFHMNPGILLAQLVEQSSKN